MWSVSQSVGRDLLIVWFYWRIEWIIEWHCLCVCVCVNELVMNVSNVANRWPKKERKERKKEKKNNRRHNSQLAGSIWMSVQMTALQFTLKESSFKVFCPWREKWLYVKGVVISGGGEGEEECRLKRRILPEVVEEVTCNNERRRVASRNIR